MLLEWVADLNKFKNKWVSSKLNCKRTMWKLERQMLIERFKFKKKAEIS